MATSQPKSKLEIVFGAMTFGAPNTQGARVHNLDEAGKILDIFQSHGHSEIDTARVYGRGTSEEFLASLSWQTRGLTMDTKLYPNATAAKLYPGAAAPAADDTEQYSHSPADVRRGLLNSLRALKTDKVALFYLHGPDRTVPFETTLREVHALYTEGRFARLGLSNYMSWEVAQIVELCRANGWVQPSVYEGIYNALHRSIEPELLPCLRHYGISLYAFQPVAGGFLTGRYTRSSADFEKGSRFDPELKHSAIHRGRYWNDTYFDALELIQGATEKHNLTVAETALRWIQFHSQLGKGEGDKLIVGASSARQLEGNLIDLEKEPLPEDVVQALDKAWAMVKGIAPKYWH